MELNKEELKIDNELIAEFDGGLKVDGEYHFVDEHWGNVWHKPSDLKYHDSWDWLKPVVDKIAEYRLAYPEQTAKVCDAKIVIRIEYLYPLVVEFINFLNTPDSKPYKIG